MANEENFRTANARVAVDLMLNRQDAELALKKRRAGIIKILNGFVDINTEHPYVRIRDTAWAQRQYLFTELPNEAIRYIRALAESKNFDAWYIGFTKDHENRSVHLIASESALHYKDIGYISIAPKNGDLKIDGRVISGGRVVESAAIAFGNYLKIGIGLENQMVRQEFAVDFLGVVATLMATKDATVHSSKPSSR